MYYIKKHTRKGDIKMSIIKNFTEAYYKRKIQKDWKSIKTVPKKYLNNGIANTALDLNYKAIQFIEKPTPNQIEKALKQNINALKYIEHTTENILLALKTNGMCLQLIKKEAITLQMCIIAIKSNINAYVYVPYSIQHLVKIHFMNQESGEIRGRFLRYIAQYQNKPNAIKENII